jgi:hypothetical protein
MVLTGNRRLAACRKLGFERIPCHVKQIRRDEMGEAEFLAEVAAYNPQRVKSVGTLLREAILRDSATLEDTAAAVRRVRATHETTFSPEYVDVDGSKEIDTISDNRIEFLNAAIRVMNELQNFWPLSIRQVHYRLLNDPPLMMTPERSKFDIEHYRYRNDKSSYQALSRLLTSARYHGHVPFHVIDDPTRPFARNSGYTNMTDFVDQEIDNFLLGYHREKQATQPIHIEVLGEKNTIFSILDPICRKYYVPMQIGRGYSGPSIFHNCATLRRVAEKRDDVARNLGLRSGRARSRARCCRDAARHLGHSSQVPSRRRHARADRRS